MNESGFSRLPSHHLDPGAQEFFPSLPPQIFLPYPPPQYDDVSGYSRPSFPAFVSAAAEPPPPMPIFMPPSSATPSRTLLLSMVPASVSESTLRRELEVFGDVRAVQMERRREGLVTVHFYDLRDAQAALGAIQEQHMHQQFRIGRHYDAVLNSSVAAFHMWESPPPPPQTARGLITGRVVWAQFTTPVTSGLPDGNNQGTLILFNLDPRVSPSYLREIFESFGPVKEVRETPFKRNQRFVEFYDVRNAAMAMVEMNGRVIYGKAIMIEFSRPGGHYKKFWKGPPHQNNGTSPPPENKPYIRQPPPPPPRRRNVNDDCRRRNPSGSDGSKSWSSGSSSIQSSMANLCVNNSGYHHEEWSNSSSANYKKKNYYFKKVNKSSTSDSGGGSSKQLPENGGFKQWKSSGGGGGGGCGGRRGKDDHDPRFLIKEDAIVESNCRDLRTTVMIKNIPNKYSQKLLMNMLDNHCINCNEQIADGDDQPLSSYDFVYLPIDFINKCNVGYGFVNMTSPEATIRLYKAFHHQNWEVFNSRKICQVTYARLQGLEALREHFKNSKFPGTESEEYMPVVFSPPRDGLVVTAPVPIVCRPVNGGSSPSPHSSAGSSPKQTLTEPHQVEGAVLFNGSSYDDVAEGVAGGAGKEGCGYDDQKEI